MRGFIGRVDHVRKIAHSVARRSTLVRGSKPMAGESRKISVILDRDEAERFDAYCKEKGFKKSSLAARLIREHLDREGYRAQGNLFQKRQNNSRRR